jgi:hypothetical protein
MAKRGCLTLNLEDGEGDGAADTDGAPDAVNLVGGWMVGGGSGGFTDYVLGGATVSIEADVAVAVV